MKRAVQALEQLAVPLLLQSSRIGDPAPRPVSRARLHASD
jgi:hypothetical protein